MKRHMVSVSVNTVQVLPLIASNRFGSWMVLIVHRIMHPNRIHPVRGMFGQDEVGVGLLGPARL